MLSKILRQRNTELKVVISLTDMILVCEQNIVMIL